MDVGRKPPRDALSWAALRARVEIEDGVNGATADDAERHVVAREHDAVRLRPVGAARLVVGAFEGADLARVRSLVEERCVPLLLFPEERVHLGLRPVRGADRPPLLLDLL